MNDYLIEVLKELGAEGLQAFYIYIILDFITFWVISGLCTWGIRTVWKNWDKIV